MFHPNRHLLSPLVLCVALASAGLAACSSESSTPTTSSTGHAGTGGSGSTTSSSSSSSSGVGGSAPAEHHGAYATQGLSGGTLGKSKAYKMFVSVGQPAGLTATSADYRLQCSVTGEENSAP